MIKWMDGRLENLFSRVDSSYNDLKKLRNHRSQLQSELSKLDSYVSDLLTLIFDSKSFVTCQDLLQFDRNNRLKIREILMKWYQSTQSINPFDPSVQYQFPTRSSVSLQRTYTK
jgi:hypothetical protein